MQNSIFRRRQRCGPKPLRRSSDEGPHAPVAAFAAASLVKRRRKRGAIYSRYSTRFQHSTEDQVRDCRAWAEAKGVEILDEHVFIDEAVTGKTHKRDGLQRMLSALAADEFDVLIVFSTNRLYRKMYRALAFVEEEIVDRNKRCVFIRQGIDTDDRELWRPLLQVFAMLDERMAAMLAAFVNAAHQGLLLKKWIHGTITFGYYGRTIPGPNTKAGNPRKEWVTDPEAARCVHKIFGWYLGRGDCTEPLGYTEIARRLNLEGAPLPPRCFYKRWSAKAVYIVLQNRRYIGDWSYGWSQVVWQNKAGYPRQVKRERPLMEHRDESLRIIDDDTFEAAQDRIACYRARAGRRKQGKRGESLPHLFENLLWCETHQCHLWSLGPKWYRCPQCMRSDSPDLYTSLSRALAAKVICSQLAAMVLKDDCLVTEIIEAFQSQIVAHNNSDAIDTAVLKRELAHAKEHLQFLYRSPAVSEEDRTEQRQIMAELQSKRALLRKQIEEIERGKAPPAVPTSKEAETALRNLGAVFQEAATSDDPQIVGAARNAIALITGGKITLTQQGERKAKRGWLRASFTVDILHAAFPEAKSATASTSLPVEIDIRKPDEDILVANEARAMYAGGHLIAEIATALGLNRNRVTKLLAVAYAQTGETLPDGRARRTGLRKKSLSPSFFERVSEPAKAMADKGMLLGDIARELHCDRNTITKALRFWDKSHSIPYLDGRLRRKTLEHKVGRPPRERNSSAK